VAFLEFEARKSFAAAPAKMGSRDGANSGRAASGDAERH
jgi:hypothetical protein